MSGKIRAAVAILGGYGAATAEEMRRAQQEEPDKTQHWCETHQTTWFMRGNMRNYAHPIEGQPGKWCNEPKVTESTPPQGSEESPMPLDSDATLTPYAQLRAEVEASGMTWDNFELEVLRCTWATFTKTRGASADVAKQRWETWKAKQEKEV